MHLVVGYTPGGGNDLIARIVAARLQEKLGQPVIVDNKPGAQSIVAAEMVARAPSDGYTLLVAPSGPMMINPAVYAKLSYSPERDFAPVSLLAEFPLLLAVGAEQPTIADSGPMAGPLKAGKLRALGITSARRNPAFPDVPTLQEAGIPDMEISLWTGIVAPIHTPSDVVKALQKAIQQVLALADVQAAMTVIAVEPRSTTLEQYRDLIVRDTARWKAVAATANIEFE